MTDAKSPFLHRLATHLCAVLRRRSSVGEIPTRQLLLQPVAIGAAVEVTKLPKPSMQRVASGDSASRQAVTRVNAEQASKRTMWEPTQQMHGEGRRHGFFRGVTRSHSWSHRGSGDGMSAQEIGRNTGNPSGGCVAQPD